jgi:hypothetical protein
MHLGVEDRAHGDDGTVRDLECGDPDGSAVRVLDDEAGVAVHESRTVDEPEFEGLAPPADQRLRDVLGTAATVLALERGTTGIYNVVDDEPAAAREWLPGAGGGRWGAVSRTTTSSWPSPFRSSQCPVSG